MSDIHIKNWNYCAEWLLLESKLKNKKRHAFCQLQTDCCLVDLLNSNWKKVHAAFERRDSEPISGTQKSHSATNSRFIMLCKAKCCCKHDRKKSNLPSAESRGLRAVGLSLRILGRNCVTGQEVEPIAGHRHCILQVIQAATIVEKSDSDEVLPLLKILVVSLLWTRLKHFHDFSAHYIIKPSWIQILWQQSFKNPI